MKNTKFLFITGSQNLYGDDVLRRVDSDSAEICAFLNTSDKIPCTVEHHPVVTTPESISAAIAKAEADPDCAGIITWMHTFSPSKMWIMGLSALKKPYLHFHTQFNRDIPWDTIDMDFMNLNQSAHGDREHGYIGARMRIARKVISGYWRDERTLERIGIWMRAAVGAFAGKRVKVARFGDNMRQVAVTEGDKVEAQIKFGWSVDAFAMFDWIGEFERITKSEADAVMARYENKYRLETGDIKSVYYQARQQAALEKILSRGGYGAFHTCFEDLAQFEQLPGLAVQDMMSAGVGFAAEGDWKTAALTRVMKLMAEGLSGGTSFMEDYTYHLEQDNQLVLGAHMLEICPSVASEKPQIRVHPLGIGGRSAPARLVFKASPGPAILVSLVDMGDRFRMIVNDVECVAQEREMPELPVAGVLWKPLPDLSTASEAWIRAGGAHHFTLSYALTAAHMRDYAELLGIEFIHIGTKTDIEIFTRDLAYSDVIYKNR